jgi:hypothetical protein
MSLSNPFDDSTETIQPKADGKTGDGGVARSNRKKVFGKGQIPWFHVAIAGGGLWVIIVLVVAGLSAFQNNSVPKEEQLPLPAIKPIAPGFAAAPVPKPADAPNAAAAPEIKPLQKEDFVDCQQIGTDVRFLKNPTEAFQRAAVEKKMVFVMHLSGNLEDKDFT